MLYVVATPIGNLEDISPRARQVLAQADIVAAEDTRHTGKLLSHFAISARQVALHDHNETEVVGRLIEAIESGKSVALVSDAGTPLISDPGYRLLVAAHEAGISVSPLPGPSAAIAALSVAGLASDRFAFEGFLPAKQEARRARLAALAKESRTLIFFESVHRVAASLADMSSEFGADRLAFIGRELSKLHEQCVRAPLEQLIDMIERGRIETRGEFVIIVAGTSDEPRDIASVDSDELLAALLQHMPGKQAVELVAKLSGRKRNDVYKAMLAIKD